MKINVAVIHLGNNSEKKSAIKLLFTYNINFYDSRQLLKATGPQIIYQEQ